MTNYAAMDTTQWAKSEYVCVGASFSVSFHHIYGFYYIFTTSQYVYLSFFLFLISSYHLILLRRPLFLLLLLKLPLPHYYIQSYQIQIYPKLFMLHQVSFLYIFPYRTLVEAL